MITSKNTMHSWFNVNVSGFFMIVQIDLKVDQLTSQMEWFVKLYN